MDTTKRKRDEEEKEKSERATKRLLEYDYNSTISIVVGQEKKLFTVHRDLICDSSKFFRAACSGRWIEGRKGKVKLPAVMPCDFQRYLAWLYSKKLSAASNELWDQAMYANIDLYILADVLDDIHLRNAAIELLYTLDNSKGLPSFCVVEKMWMQTPATSFLRKLYVQKFVLQLEAEHFEELKDQFPMEFVQNIAVAALRYRDDNRGFVLKLESFLELVPEDD